MTRRQALSTRPETGRVFEACLQTASKRGFAGYQATTPVMSHNSISNWHTQVDPTGGPIA